MVEQGSSLECRDHPGQQAQDTGEQQGGHGQFQGRREKGGEFGPHAGTGTQRFAKVALGEFADIVQILRIQRLVKAKALHCLCVHLGVDSSFAHHDFDGVAGDHANQRKRQQRDAEKRGDQ